MWSSAVVHLPNNISSPSGAVVADIDGGGQPVDPEDPLVDGVEGEPAGDTQLRTGQLLDISCTHSQKSLMNSAGGHRYNQGCGYRSDRVRNVFEVSRTEVNGFGFLYLWPDFRLRRFSIQIRTPIFDFRWFSIQNRIPILDDSLSRSQFSVKIIIAYITQTPIFDQDYSRSRSGFRIPRK